MKFFTKIFINTGAASILVMVMGVTIAIAVGGLVLVAASQYTFAGRSEAFEKSLSLAEAGIEYYRWHLAHNQEDYFDGTGEAGTYTHQINDPQTNTNGFFSLNINPPATGSGIITITSEGWVDTHPEIKRTIVAKYGNPSFTKYAFLNNANMWFGTKTVIHGPVFSNGGIRMDAEHDSSVGSAKETYTCGAETGCDPSQVKPGIWGEGGPQELWIFPTTQIDFNSVAVNFGLMKQSAENNGIHLEPSGSYGYHIEFLEDGSVNISTIDSMKSSVGWSVEEGCETLYQEIHKETLINNYNIENINIIFSEDHLWIDGVVNGSLSVVAARFPIDNYFLNVWINSNLTYLAKDGSSNIGIVAQNDIIFPLDIPAKYEINGALFAYKGKVIRHNYKYQGCSHEPHAVRPELFIYGSIISNLKSYWSYGQGQGYEDGPASGFSHQTITYDPNLYEFPPPFFPTLNTLEMVSWEEM